MAFARDRSRLRFQTTSGASRSAMVSRRRMRRAFDPSTSTSAGARTRVVVGALRHAVRAGIEQGDEIAGLDGRKLAVARKKVARLANRTHHIDDARLPCPRPHGNNLVPGLVERGTDQVVHRRVGDDEGLFAVALHVEYARHQRPGLGDKKTSRLDEQASFEIAQRVFERRGVLLDLGGCVEGPCGSDPGVIINAESAAGIDGLGARCLRAAAAAPACSRVRWPRQTAPRSESASRCGR